MQDCLFCKIVSGEIPSNKIYEDDTLIAFYDIDPKAPVHVLIVPKVHIRDITDPSAAQIAPQMFSAAAAIAQELGVDKKGFRCVLNTGRDGGQSVAHLHMHVLGGRTLNWPPG